MEERFLMPVLPPVRKVLRSPFPVSVGAVFLVVGLVACSSPAEIQVEEFQRGLEAQDRGDIAATLKDWIPLARVGFVPAQYNLGLMYRSGTNVPQNNQKAAEWFRLAAKQGDVRAQYMLGVMYALGQGVAQDSVYASMWLDIVARSGDKKAQTQSLDLARALSPADMVRSEVLEETCLATNLRNCTPVAAGAADAGAFEQTDAGDRADPVAAVKPSLFVRLGNLDRASVAAAITNIFEPTKPDLLEGNYAFIRGEFSKALDQWRPLAEVGSVDAQFNMGWAYEHGKGVPQDYYQAATWYQLAADQELARAQYRLGTMYLFGRGIPQNDRQAMKWYRRAATQGEARAQFALGKMFLEGVGIPKDIVSALLWWKLAAMNGNARAKKQIPDVSGNVHPADIINVQRWVRHCLESNYRNCTVNSALTPPDYRRGLRAYQIGDATTAIKEWLPLAEAGDAESQLRLSLMYDRGKGVPQDSQRALFWVRKAAGQGFAAAEFRLGVIHAQSRGTRQNDRQAVKWYRKAAEQKLGEAQVALGLMYREGAGVPRDLVQALMWWNLAAVTGGSDVVRLRDRLAQDMDAVDISLAEDLAAACIDTDYRNCPDRPATIPSIFQ